MEYAIEYMYKQANIGRGFVMSRSEEVAALKKKVKDLTRGKELTRGVSLPDISPKAKTSSSYTNTSTITSPPPTTTTAPSSTSAMKNPGTCKPSIKGHSRSLTVALTDDTRGTTTLKKSGKVKHGTRGSGSGSSSSSTKGLSLQERLAQASKMAGIEARLHTLERTMRRSQWEGEAGEVDEEVEAADLLTDKYADSMEVVVKDELVVVMGGEGGEDEGEDEEEQTAPQKMSRSPKLGRSSTSAKLTLFSSSQKKTPGNPDPPIVVVQKSMEPDVRSVVWTCEDRPVPGAQATFLVADDRQNEEAIIKEVMSV